MDAASELSIEVAGDDPSNDHVVSFGAGGIVRGLITAPHGTMSFGASASATGAFAAFDVVAGDGATFSFDTGIPSNPAGQQGSQVLTGYFGIQADATFPVLDPVPSSMRISLSVGLPVRDAAGLQQFIDHVSKPGDPMYRKYVTIDQFRSSWGATDADYQALQQWALANGLRVDHTYANNLLLTVSGTAAQWEKVLYTNLVFRRADDGITKFVTVDRDPSLDLGPQVLWITGLDQSVVARNAACTEALPSSATGSPGGTTGLHGGFMAGDLRAAYLGDDCESLNLDGDGQVVGILSFDLYRPDDIASYAACQTTHIAPDVLPFLDTEPDFSQYIGFGDGEVELDIEMVLAMAPKAKIDLFEGASAIGGNEDDLLHHMANDLEITVASNSYYFKGTQNSAQAISEMAARGISFYSASGDYGNVGNPGNVIDQPNQTIVGGTILRGGTQVQNLTPANTCPGDWIYCPPIIGINGPINTTSCYYQSEATWNLGCPAVEVSIDPHSGAEVLKLTDHKDITGGGIMAGTTGALCGCFPEPYCCLDAVPIPTSYQDPGLMDSITDGGNGGSKLFRNYPDVSAVADSIEYFAMGSDQILGGTSSATPIWAGWTALANQLSARHHLPPVGFANPALYAIGGTRGKPGDQDIYKIAFHDIADGVTNSNTPELTGFPAIAGYDLATGWGTPTCGLIKQMGTSNPTVAQNFDIVIVHVAAGGDGVDDDSSVKLFLRDAVGATMTTLTLKHPGESGWGQGTEHDFSFSLATDADPPLAPLTPLGIGRVTVQINGEDDDWDITGMQVLLASSSATQKPGSSTYACVTDRSGNDGDVTRISSADNGGPTTATFTSDLCGDEPNCHASGCSTWGGSTPIASFDALHFLFDTTDDDLNSDSTVTADIFTSSDCTGDALRSEVILTGPGITDQTQREEEFLLQPPLTYQDIGCIKLTLAAGPFNGEDEWHLGAVEIYGVQASSDWERTCMFYGTELSPTGCGSTFNDQPCSEFKFDTDDGPTTHTLTTGFNCR